MNLQTPEANRQIVIWDSSDNAAMTYSDYLLCSIDEEGKVLIHEVGSYNPETEEVTFNKDNLENYVNLQHMDFNDLCTGFEDDFNDWAYLEDFNGPVFMTEEFIESALKKFKEGILEVDEEDIRDAKEDFANEVIGSDAEVDLSGLTDEEMDTLDTVLYDYSKENFFESVKVFVNDMKLAEATDELTLYALQKHFDISEVEAKEMLEDLKD